MSKSSIDVAEEFVEHFGTKGMKWGVRRADKKWAKNIYSVKGAVDVHNAVAEKMNNGGIDALNKRHPKAHLDHDTPATRAYLKDYENLTLNYTKAAVASVHGVSPSGTMRATLKNEGGWRIEVESTEVKHADDVLPTLVFELTVSDGKVESMRLVDDELAQDSIQEGEDFIEHFGVKGMRWGVRKRRNESERARTFNQPRSKKNIKDMSDQELREVLNRMNMEQQYSNLSKKSSGRSVNQQIMGLGATFVGGIALNIARQQIQNQANAKISAAFAARAAAKKTGPWLTRKAVNSIGRTVG